MSLCLETKSIAKTNTCTDTKEHIESFTMFYLLVCFTDENTGVSITINVFSSEFFMYHNIFVKKILDEAPIENDDFMTGLKYMLLASYYMKYDVNKVHLEKIVDLLNKSIEKKCTHSNLLLAVHCYVNQIYDDETNDELFNKCIELGIHGTKEMRELVESYRQGPKKFLIEQLIEGITRIPFDCVTEQSVEEIVTKWADDLYAGKTAQFETVIAHYIKHRSYTDALNCYLSVNDCLNELQPMIDEDESKSTFDAKKLKSIIDVEELKHYHHFIIDTFHNIFIDFVNDYFSKDDIADIIFRSTNALVTIDINESALVLEKFCDIILWTERFDDLEKAVRSNKWIGENMDTFHNVFGARCVANEKCEPALEFLVKIGSDSKYLVSVGSMCYDAGDHTNAKKYYSKAVELEANNPLVRDSIENEIRQKYGNGILSIWNIVWSFFT